MTVETISHVGDWLVQAPWRDRKVSLMLIGDDIREAFDMAGKRAIIESQTGRIIVLWSGAYKTNARLIYSPEDRAAVAKKLA